MSITSMFFILLFFPIFLGMYLLLHRYKRWQNAILYLASLVYVWSIHWFLVLILIAFSTINHLLAKRIILLRRKKKTRQSKVILFLACTINVIGISIFFILPSIPLAKENLFLMARYACPPALLVILLLQVISYFSQLWQRSISSHADPLSVFLGFAFFPILFGGPPLASRTLHRQFLLRRPNQYRFSNGCTRFVIGLGKKSLISAPLGAMADRIFDLSTIGRSLYCVPASLAWLGVLAYGLQIYYELSAYADMALGIGMMLGYRWKESFYYPYLSVSMHEFWQRWNVLHSQWFQVNIHPLLSSHIQANRLMTQIVFPCLFIGLCFGRGISSLIWAAWHILFMTIEFIINQQYPSNGRQWKRTFYVLFVVAIGWIILRSPDIYQASEYIKNLFGMNQNGFFSPIGMMFLKENALPLLVGILFCFPVARYIAKFSIRPDRSVAKEQIKDVIYIIALIIVYLLSLIRITQGMVPSFHLFG